MVLATDGGVAVSSDGGFTFQRVDRGFPTVQLYTCAIGLRDSSSLFGGTQDNDMNIYRGAAGDAWELSLPPRRGDITGISVHPNRPEEVVAVTAEALGVGISVDEGGAGSRPAAGSGRRRLSMGCPAGAQSAPPGAGLLRAGHLPETSPSTAAGTGTRSRSGSRDDPTLSIVEVAVSPSPAVDGELWTIWTDGKVFVSFDRGLNWQERSPPGGARAGMRISAGPAPGTAYAALSGTTGARLFRTRDHGATWEDISRDLPELPLNAVLADPRAAGRLFVATDAGVALSLDDGADLAGCQRRASERGRARPLPRPRLRPPRRRHLRPRPLGAQVPAPLPAGRDHALPQ